MATDIRLQLGQRIRELRRARSWRQIDLAEHSGLNKIYICDLERGEKNMSLLTIQTLAATFNLKPSELLKGAGL